MSQDLCRDGNVSLLVYLLVILFGVSSWVDINGLWVELPILVQHLPEGWDLPSYMAIIIQVANVAPLAYTVASTIYPHRTIEVPVIYVIIGTGAVSCLLLAFLWRETLVIAGTERSIAFLTLQFFLSLVDCTTSVAFLPFMTLFPPQYMTAYFMGEGFSGLIPSLVALGQGAGNMKCVNSSGWSNFGSDAGNTSFLNGTTVTSVGLFQNSTEVFANITSGMPVLVSFVVQAQYQPPRFSTKVFFLILMVMLIISGVSFSLLKYWSYCKRYHVQVPPEGGVTAWSDGDTEQNEVNSLSDTLAITNKPDFDLKCVTYHGFDTNKSQDLLTRKSHAPGKTKNISCSKQKPCQTSHSTTFSTSSSSTGSGIADCKKRILGMSRFQCFMNMAVTAWLCSLSNAMLPSIQSYSCLPYGIQPYHLVVTLASITNPVACFVTFLIKMTSLAKTLFLTILATALSAFLMFTAFASPDPPLVNHSSGSFVIVFSWVLTVSLMTYTKVSIATALRHKGPRAMLWVGVNTQLGSLIGAIVIFLMVNHFKLFKVANPCL